MSSSDAQRSPVHHATEDSTAEPTAPGRAATAGRQGDGARGRAGGDAGRDASVAREAEALRSRPDTALGVPGNFERGAATAGVHPDSDPDANPPGVPVIGGGPGAGDSSSGGGAGAGVPGGGTDMRTNGAFSGGDVQEDRRKLFPGQSAPGAGPGREETAVGKDPDESSYGGPLDLDNPDAV